MTWSSIEGLLRVLGRGTYETSSTAGLSTRADARDQDVDHALGGPLTIRSQADVRNTGERTQQVERIKLQPDVAAQDRAVDQLRNCLLHLCRRRRVQIGCPFNN